MADNKRDVMSETSQQRRTETSDGEHDRIRASNDKDQELEREGVVSRHNRGYDDAVKGNVSEPEPFEDLDGDVDPDSAASDNDRDDTLDSE